MPDFSNGRTPWKKNHSSVSWSSAGQDSIKALVTAVTDSGNAIMFARTIDGSALVLSIFSGQDKAKEYVTDVGDIPSLFAWAIEHFS